VFVEIALLGLGVGCLIAGIVGGNLRLPGGPDLPALTTPQRVAIWVLGAVLLAAAVAVKIPRIFTHLSPPAAAPEVASPAPAPQASGPKSSYPGLTDPVARPAEISPGGSREQIVPAPPEEESGRPAPDTSPVPPRPAPAPPPPVSVQFYPKRTTGDFKDIEVEPCVQTDRTLVCTIFVTQNGGRGPGWMAYKQSTIQDENGAEIAPSLITVGSVSHDPRRGGKRIPITMGTRTRIVYVYDGVADATKLQTFNLTVCCTHNISLHPQ